MNGNPVFSVESFDLAYQEHPTVLLARIYKPQGPGPFPCIVDVHGGGWGRGDRLDNVALNRALCQCGIVIAALDFRLSDDAPFPASVADVNLGIRWLKSVAGSFAGRADLVGGLGTSSGAHQLLLNALRPLDPEYASSKRDEFPDVDASLHFAVACWPVADPLARYRMALQHNREDLVRSHDTFWASEEEMAAGNPQLIVERGEQTHLPPLLIVQGTADENLPADTANRFAAAYRKGGGLVELAMFDRQPHAFVTREPESEASSNAITAMAAFIKRRSQKE